MGAMGKIVVFDSGFGSLSIIKAIQRTIKADIVYFADQKNYPYGKKTKLELRKIIVSTIKLLQEHFKPDVIVVGSNTPTLLLPKLFSDHNLIGVLPPAQQASEITKTKSIAVLATSASVQSKDLSSYIKKNIANNISVKKIDASILVDLVESGKFITEKQYCETIIRKTLEKIFTDNYIDTVTLSSTHLPFLLSYLQKIFPTITFLDPADLIAKKIKQNKLFVKSKRNSLKIFTTADPISFQKKLVKINVKNKVTKFR